MKKLFVTLLLAASMSANAQHLEAGYHGFVDAGFATYTFSQLSPTAIPVTTTHGYQFNPYLFLGAGVGFYFTSSSEWGEVGDMPYNKRKAKTDIPVFFNIRTNFTKTRFSPFFDGKVGVCVNNGGGIYINPSIGCRYAINDMLGLSFSVGYEMRKVDYLQLATYTLSSSKYGYLKTSYSYTNEDGRSLDGLTFKLGFDF